MPMLVAKQKPRCFVRPSLPREFSPGTLMGTDRSIRGTAFGQRLPGRHAVGWMAMTPAMLFVLAAIAPWPGPAVDGLSACLPASPILAMLALAAGGRTAMRLLSLSVLIIAVVLISREATGGRPTRCTAPALTIVTHNVARRNVDPAQTAAVLLASDADVILLQEVDGTFRRELVRLRTRYPFGSSCFSRCSLAVLSRWPTGRVRWRFHDAGGRAIGPGLIVTTVRLPWGGTAKLASIHLSREEPASARERKRLALASAAALAGGPDLVLGGDFNLTPWGGAMRRLDRSMAPMRRVTHALPSFPARWNGVVLPPLLPIDHLYVSTDWTVAGIQRMARTGSDHFPVRAKLLWRCDRV